MSKKHKEVKYNCTDCIHSSNIQFFDHKSKKLKTHSGVVICRSVKKLDYILEKTGKLQILFPMFMPIGNHHCSCKEVNNETKTN